MPSRWYSKTARSCSSTSGIDTVQMKGDGFRTLVEKGARVTVGTPLLEFDLKKIAAAGHPAITPVIVLNNENAQIEFKK